MSKNILNSKFALAAILGSTLVLNGCGSEKEGNSDIIQLCKFTDRSAVRSKVDPSFIELKVSVFPILPLHISFSASGIYTEDEVKEIAMNYCLNNEYPQFP